MNFSKKALAVILAISLSFSVFSTGLTFASAEVDTPIKTGYNVTIADKSNPTSVEGWMDGVSVNDPTNIIRGISPTATYTDESGTSSITVANTTDGIFNDNYAKCFADDTWDLDSTYATLTYDFGKERKFSEAWLLFKEQATYTYSAFVPAKYQIFVGNDLATLYNTPLITVTDNTNNVNTVKFPQQTARYFALRIIKPGQRLWAGTMRASLMELSVVGVVEISQKVDAVDENGDPLEVTIGGTETTVESGNNVTISAPKSVTNSGKTYFFETFKKGDTPIISTLNGNNYEANVAVSGTAITAQYIKAAELTLKSAYVSNNTMVEIPELAKADLSKTGKEFTTTYPLSYDTEYSLLGWLIGGQFVVATSDGILKITPSGDTEIIGVYAKDSSGGSVNIVSFKTTMGEQLGTFFVSEGSKISDVVTAGEIEKFKMPAIFGYSFAGWSESLDTVPNTTMTITPVYQRSIDTYSLSVNGVEKENVAFDQKVTVTSTNDNFSSWNNGDSIISTEKSYSFYMPGQIDLTENTIGARMEVTDESTIDNGIVWADGNKFNFTVLAKISGIEKENFIEAGVVFTKASTYMSYGDKANEKFVLGSSDTVSCRLKKYPTGSVYMVTLSKIAASGERAARSYVKYYLNGKEYTAYSRTVITATKDGVTVPEAKYENAATKYAAHPSLKLYGDKDIPYYDATYAAKSVSGSSENGNNPTITPYIVDGAKSSVIIYPGGGYCQRSDQGEGIAIAQEYNKAGFSAFVVRYRVGDLNGGYNDQAIFTDGMRAVQFVRYNAKEFGIDPTKIAVCGFSAGGHLAMSVSQNEMEGNVVGDQIGEVSNKPAAVILSYAVTTLQTGTFGWMPIVLGQRHTEDEKTAILAKYSGQLHANADTPATFLWYGEADTAVPPSYNSVAYYDALQAAGVTSEIHSYEGVGHGVGLNTNGAAAGWHALSVTFLKEKAGL